MLASLSACTLFGGGDADPDPPIGDSSPLGNVKVTLRVRIPATANPLGDRYILGLFTDTTELFTATFLVNDSSLAADSLIELVHTWDSVPAGSTLEAYFKGYDDNHWVLGSSWQGVAPLRRDTTIQLVPHPIYDGFYSPFDTLPQLQGLLRTSFTVKVPPGSDSLFGFNLVEAKRVDSVETWAEPGQVHLIFSRDSLYSANDFAKTSANAAKEGMERSRFPDSGMGHCRILKLTIGERTAYQTMTQASDFYSLWDEAEARSAWPIKQGHWWLIFEEDNAYMLHALAIDTVAGMYIWEFYRRR